MIEYSIVFMAGLLSSLHCVGMCGPIIMSFQAPVQNSGAQMTWNKMFINNALYNISRIASYTLLGALFGYIGMQLSFIKVISVYISKIGGVLLIVAGLLLLDIFSGVKIFPVSWSLSISKFLGRFFKKNTPGVKILFGLLTPLLPCGILYAMFIQAASEESAMRGALTMAMFALGTSASLLLLGTFSSLVSLKIRKRADKIAAVLVIFLGVILLMRGMQIPYLGWLLGGQEAGHCIHH